jgi:hypothetical protein
MEAKSINWKTQHNLYAMLPYMIQDDRSGRLSERLTDAFAEWVYSDANILRSLTTRRQLKHDYLRELNPIQREQKKLVFELYDRNLEESARILAKIEDEDKLQLNYGGDFWDLTNPYMRAYNGEIPLTPENFESLAQNSFDSYGRVFTALENAQYRYDPKIPRNQQPNKITYRGDNEVDNPAQIRVVRREDMIMPQWYNHNIPSNRSMYGWNKKDLQQAIANSGLVIQRKLPYKDSTGQIVTMGIPLSSVNIQSVRSPGLEDEIYLPGIFSKTAYMPRNYYENLYREIFGTIFQLNISQICNIKYNRIGRTMKARERDATIRAILKRSFNVEIPIDNRIDREELCDILTREFELMQNPERIQALTLAREAQENQEPLIYQPNSRWVTPESPTFNPDTIVHTNVPVESQEWREIRQACNNLEGTSRGLFVFYAQRLGITLSNNENKASICRKLTRTLDVLRGQR